MSPAHPVPAGDPRGALRFIDAFTLHREPLDALPLLLSVVREDTRYLVLDLDRTVHRGWNMGELLGWEVIAHLCYGPERLERAEVGRGPGRFHLDPGAPGAMLRYLIDGVRRWAVPGLTYLFGVKLASRRRWSRRVAHHVYGPDPVAAVQAVPRLVVMHHLAELPVSTLRTLAERVWDRCRADQVILRTDLEALRRRFPGLRIILSSASPEAIVEVARERLGADAALCSDVPVRQGRPAAPYRVDWRFGMSRLPASIAGPSELAHNAGRLKMPRLRARFPDFAAHAASAVGVTDTGYGEDHDWAHHFGHLVDVNSGHPFSPIVHAGSPLRTLRSARLRARAEREAGPLLGDGGSITMRRGELAWRLAGSMQLLRGLEARRARAEESVAARLRAKSVAFAALHRRIDAAAAAYNAAPADERSICFGQLEALAREEAILERELAILLRPVAALSCALRDAHARARHTLQEALAAPPRLTVQPRADATATAAG